MANVVSVETNQGVAVLTLRRPDKLNALDVEVLEALRAALGELKRSGGARALILTGEGKAFVAGADIAAMQAMTEAQAHAFASLGHATLDAIEALPFPAIAAVNGFALGGGCELALACDLILASEKAKFGQPEVKLGVIPGFGGTQRLLRRVGAAKARELIYTGATIDAPEAHRIGLANAVVPADELMARATEVATTIASVGPLAVAAAKRVIREGEDAPLGEANRREVDAFARLFTTADQKEGMSAFLAKRAATFEGR